MKRAMLTFGVGGYAELLDIAMPSFRRFADLHGWELLDVGPTYADEPPDRPPSWWKIPALISALDAGYDEVLWVGADVVIVDPSEDITAPADAWQAMVLHHTGDGQVANCEVWLLRPSMRPLLEQAWGMTQHLNHGWWEQAAILELMGFQIAPLPIRRMHETELFNHTHFLDPAFNVHKWHEPAPEHPRFQHATMYPDRAAVMREWAQQAAIDQETNYCPSSPER